MLSIAFDSFSSGNTAAAGTYSFNHTFTGSNGVMFAATSDKTSSVTYNGVSLTKYTDYTPTTPPGTNCRPIRVWTLSNPSSGTNLVEVTTTGADTCVVATYTSVDNPYNPLFNFLNMDTNNVQVSTLTYGITTTIKNSWVVSFVIHTGFSKSMTAGAGTVLRGENVGGLLANGLAIFDNNAAVDPPASTNITVNMASGSEFLTMIVYELPVIQPFQGQMTIL